MSKNSNDTVGNRTRDLLACSVVPQPTPPPRAPLCRITCWKLIRWLQIQVLYFVWQLSFVNSRLNSTEILSIRRRGLNEYDNRVYRQCRPWGFQEVEAPRFQDNRHMKVVRFLALRSGRLYPPRKYTWYSFLLEAESTPRPIARPEVLCQWKIPMTQSGIEPATCRFVEQCLDRLRHRPWAWKRGTKLSTTVEERGKQYDIQRLLLGAGGCEK